MVNLLILLLTILIMVMAINSFRELGVGTALGRALAAIIAVNFMLCVAVNLYASLSPRQRLLFFLLLPFLLLAGMNIAFPHAAWLKKTTEFLFELFIFLLTLPIRIIWRSIRLVAEREWKTPRLAPREIVVGRQPKMEQPADGTKTQPPKAEKH